MKFDRALLVDTTWPSWPQCDEEQIAAAERVLRSGRLNYWTGDEGRQFEREFAQYVGAEHAVAVSSGTAALELALWALGIGAGDEIIVPARTFVATASAVVRCGATPVFADVDRNSQNITADTIQPTLTKRTKAIIAVHLAGWPCDIDAIRERARRQGVAVVEDCAEAHGARYQGRSVGSLGDIAAFSFCQDKIMTTAGEGGMIVTNHTELWKRAWSLKDHGKSVDAMAGLRNSNCGLQNEEQTISANDNRRSAAGNSFRWLHERVGTNWRMTEVQSAVGRVALRKLAEWAAARRRNAAILNERLTELPALRLTQPPADVFHSYYKYYAFVRPERLAPGWSRDRILAEINGAGVPCFGGSCPEVYLEQAFQAHRPQQHRLPVARELGETSLMLQVHPTLKSEHLERTAAAIMGVLRQASIENR